MSGLIHDNAREVLRAIRESGGLRADGRLRAEMKWFFENAGLRARYCRRNGMTVDELGEMLVDRGYVLEIASEREVLDILADLFAAGGRRATSATREQNDHECEEQHKADVRRKTRLRLYECAECSKKLRVADDHLTAEHVHVDPETLAETRAPFILKTVQLESLPF